jgi:hypothetical protein
MEDTQERDPHLWKLALKRANFKRHLGTYIVVNGFLWAMWFFTNYKEGFHGIPWPIWSTLGWGIGVYFGYRDAYSDSSNQADKEYNKLKKERGGL